MCHLSKKHPKKYAEVKQRIEEEKQRAAKRTHIVNRARQAMLNMMSKNEVKLETSSRHKRLLKKLMEC